MKIELSFEKGYGMKGIRNLVFSDTLDCLKAINIANQNNYNDRQIININNLIKNKEHSIILGYSIKSYIDKKRDNKIMFKANKINTKR